MNFRLILSLLGYTLLLYILILLPFNLYTPTSHFNLHGILWFIHLMLLYIHEAGHLIFSLFGSTIRIMGGSLMQILAPLAWFVIAKREGSSLSNPALFFTGVSIADVSIYVKDAEVLQLPLIGGLSKAHHDWRNLLGRWEMIDSAFAIGEILFWCGMILSVYGIYQGVRTSLMLYRTSPGSENSIPSS